MKNERMRPVVQLKGAWGYVLPLNRGVKKKIKGGGVQKESGRGRRKKDEKRRCLDHILPPPLNQKPCEISFPFLN